jgi:hypothetical protein
MKCEICLVHETSFPTEDDFVKFARQLNGKLNDNSFSQIEDTNPSRYRFSSQYRCNKCGAKWRLVEPDHAFRGEWSQIS